MPSKIKLNLFDATMIVIGNMVGAGIFTTAGFLAGELQNPWFFNGIWIIGGILTLCGALTYAEMTGMFPQSGGDYLYLKAAYGPWAGFLLNWICFWIINPGSIAVLSIAMTKYMSDCIGINEKFISLIIVLFFSTVNLRGIRLSGINQNFWTIGSLALLIFFIIGGFSSGKGNWEHFSVYETNNFSIVKVFGPAMIAVIFSYSGWFVTSYIGNEIKKPERNIPLSLILGTTIVMALYVAINAVYLYAIPVEDLKGVVNVGQAAGKQLMSSGIVHIITFAIILAIGASINATILAGAHLSYAIAKDGYFWSHIDKLHAHYRTPHIAFLIQAILACFYIIFNTFESLLSTVVFVMLISSAGSAMAHIILRMKSPMLKRPFKTPGYPFTPVIFIIAYLFIAIQIFMSSPKMSIAGIAITLSGIPFYLFTIHIKKVNSGHISFQENHKL